MTFFTQNLLGKNTLDTTSYSLTLTSEFDEKLL